MKDGSRVHTRPVLLLALLSTLFSAGIFQAGKDLSFLDWDYHLAFLEFGRKSLLEYRQFPLWTPYNGGGMPGMANPQSSFLSPLFPLVLIFGSMLGAKLQILVGFFLGSIGVYRLARDFGRSTPAAVTAALVYMFNGMFAFSLIAGMFVFISGAFLPWVYLVYNRALEKSRNNKYLICSGILITFIFFSGGYYHTPIALLLIAVLSGLQVLKTKSLIAIRNLLVVVVIFALTSGIKLLPAYELMTTFPRKIDDESGFSLQSLKRALLSREKSFEEFYNWKETSPRYDFLYGASYGLDENATYIGPLGIALMLLGISTNWKKQWKLSAVAIIFLWLSFGNRIPISLWEVVHSLPLYDSMRVAQRMRFVFMIPLSIFAGFGIDGLRSRYDTFRGKKLGKIATAALVSALYADLWFVNGNAWSQAFQYPKELRIPQSAQASFIQSCASQDLQYPLLKYNIGSLSPHEEIPISINATCYEEEAYKGEYFLLEQKGRVTSSRWSPNTLVLKVDVSKPDLLVVNQNYSNGWRVSGLATKQIQRYNGLLAMTVTPEDEEITLRYLPTSFMLGVALSMVSAGGLLVYGYLRIQKGRKDGKQ